MITLLTLLLVMWFVFAHSLDSLGIDLAKGTAIPTTLTISQVDCDAIRWILVVEKDVCSLRPATMSATDTKSRQFFAP